ncbi:DUF3533 domain-containing protein [Rhodococcus sp. X156]|uniref:DUF3533 domain-containing protein n=1 Tax=Rhodococcus sp. X156 TaxID=2499145 RepID=UPI000FD72B80|nr:DUF3533 domain-containing protein [Rhodococcus sp. X156]
MATDHGDRSATAELELAPTRDTGRTAIVLGGLVVLGVLILQLGFILSYVGAFHDPAPRDVDIAVVGPAPAAEQTVAALGSLPGHPLSPSTTTSVEQARSMVANRDVESALVLGPDGRDTLLVASAASTSVADAVETVVTQFAAAQQRTVTVDDLVPISSGDNRGLSDFYIAVGWVVGGYLLATVMELVAGSSRAPRTAARRLLVAVGYAVLSGIGTAIIVEPVLGVYSGHFWSLAALGALVVFATFAFTLFLEAALDFVGIGLVIGLFVVLGNPSAGGAYGTQLIPPFWAAIGPWLTPGAATSGVRNIAYFHGTEMAQPLGVLFGYAVVGVVGAMVAATYFDRRARRKQSPSDTTAATGATVTI